MAEFESKVQLQSISTQAPLRRQVLGLGLGLLGIAAGPLPLFGQNPTPATQKRRRLLVQPSGIPSLDTRSKIVLELEGELQLKEPDPKKKESIRRAEVKAKSTLDYFETIAFADSKLVASGRSYVEAQAKNWISGSAASQKLRPECTETRMVMHDGSWQQFCPTETLDLRETELLHSPINSAALELLLPLEPAKPSSTWTISSDSARSIFNLEAVHRSTLTARIAKVENGVATIAIDGDLEATANSVPTKLNIKGNLRAKVASHCAIVTWVGIVIKETREISQSQPGFSVTARIQLIRTETQRQPNVSGQELRKLAVQDEAGRWLVRLRSTAGRYTMLADRRWCTYLDIGEEAILRLVENNTVIAQCNITPLPALEAGSKLTLEGMQADIRKSLGKNFGEFLESKEKVTSGKLHLLRSVVVGMTEDVPVQWIYNHLSDDTGRRTAIIYTMGGNQTDRFAAADEQMTSSFELLAKASPSAETPTPAPKRNASQKANAARR